MRQSRGLTLCILLGLSAAFSGNGMAEEPFPETTYSDYRQLLGQVSRNEPTLEVAWGADGLDLFTVGPTTVTAWDWQTGTEVWRLDGSWSSQTRFVLSPESSQLAIGTGPDLELRSLPAGDLLTKQSVANGDNIDALAMGPKSQVAVGTARGDLCIWRPEVPAAFPCSRSHQTGIRAIAFDSVDQRIISAARDEIVMSRKDRESEVRYVGSWGEISALALSVDSAFLAFGTADGNLWLGRTGAISESHLLTSDFGSVSEIHFSPDGSLLVAGDLHGNLESWQVDTGLPSGLALTGHDFPIRGLDIDSQSKLLVSSSADGRTRVWSLATGHLVRTLEGHAAKISQLALSPDGQWLGLIGSPPSVTLWDLELGRESFRLVAERALEMVAAPHEVTSLAVVSKGDLLAIGSRNGTFQLIGPREDESRTETVCIFQGNQRAALMSLAFDLSGEQVALGCQNGSIFLVDTSDAESLAVPLGQSEGPVTALEFKSDEVLLSADQSGLLIRWSVASRQELERVKLSGGEVGSAWTVDPWSDALLATPGGEFYTWAEAGALQPLLRSSEETIGPVFDYGGPRRAWVDRDRTVRVETFDESLDAYTETWRLLSGARSNWISCAPPGRCLRQEDGTFWVSDSDGTISKIPPSDPAHSEELTVEILERSLSVPDGQSVSAVIEIENRSKNPAYWLQLRQAREGGGGLVFLPPPSVHHLGAGDRVSLVGALEVKSSFENPKNERFELFLELVTASGSQALEGIEVVNQVPRLGLKEVDWNQTKDQLEIILQNQGDVGSHRVLLELFDDGILTAIGEARPLAPREEEKVYFPLPSSQGFEDGEFRLSANNVEFPAHRWWFSLRKTRTLADRMVVPLGALAFIGCAWFFYFRHFWDPAAIRILRQPEEIFNLPADQLKSTSRALGRTNRLQSILGQVGLQRSTLKTAIAVLDSEDPEERHKIFAEHLGLEPVGEIEGSVPRRRHKLGPEFPLNLHQCLLELPPLGSTADGIIRSLDAQPATKKEVTLILAANMEVQGRLSNLTGRENSWVAPTSQELTRLLLEPNSQENLAKLIGGHVAATKISPYQLGQGVTKSVMFFGREAQLNQIQHGTPSNFLLVGARQVGKSSLLKALERRLAGNPEVSCRYLALSDDVLVERIAEKLGVTSDRPTANDLRSHLKASKKRYLILIDEVDSFIRSDKKNGFRGLNVLRSLSEEGKCHFVLAGYWDLFVEARIDYMSPIRNFGEVVEIGALEEEACYRLIKEPMRRMNLKFENEEIVHRLIWMTGRRANLICIACHEIINHLGARSRMISDQDLDVGLYGTTMLDALNIGRFDGTDGDLERLISNTTVAEDEFSLADLRKKLEGQRFGDAAIDQAIRRMQLACVLAPRGSDRYFYQVPLYREMIKQSLSR